MPKPTIAVPSAELVAIIAPHPPTLAPTASVLEAIAQIVSESNRCPLGSETIATHSQALECCVLVLADDRLLGIVTAGDLVRLSATGQSLAATPIAEIMSAPVQTLDLADLADPFVALRLFEQHAISHLPIVDEQGGIVGLLTRDRLLQQFPSLNLLRRFSIAEVMTQTGVQALPTTTLAELAQLMTAHAVGWVVIGEGEEQATADEKRENWLQPFCDRKLKPMGVVTHQAIVQALALEFDLAAVQAQTVMAELSGAIGVADSGWDAYQVMQAQAVNQVVVTHDRGWLLGMVTRSNLLSALNPLALYRMTEQLMQERTEAHQQVQAELAECQRIEATLGASEERWQLLLRGNHDGIWDWNLITHQIFYSSRWKQMRGFAEDEIGDSPNECLDRIHPDDYDHVMAEVNDHLAGKTEFFETEYRSQCKDGSYIWVHDRAQSLRNEAGQVIRMSGSDTDITPRKLAEAALRESERRYATLAAAAPVAIFQFDSLFNLIYANDRWSKMTGRLVESALGDGWVEALHPDDREVLLAKWFKMHAQAPPGTQVLNGGEGRHLRPDGSINWFYVQIAREMDAEGNVVGYIGTLTDITERKQAEQQLQHLSDRLELAIKSAQIGIWEWDIESNSLIWDDRMYVLYGVKAADFSGAYAAWINGIHPDDLPMALEDSRLALASEKDYDSEFRVVLPDGKIRILKAHALVQRDPQGQALKMIGINYDITDRKQAEQALQKSQRFIQQIADASPNLLYLYDLQEHRNVYVNREIGTILGYTPEEIQAMGAHLFQNLIHPDDFTRLPEHYAKLYAAQDGEILDFEYRMRHANGEWRWLYSRDSIFSRDETGRARQTIGTAQDMTERKRLEQAQHRLIALLEASTDYILIADLSGTAIWNNTALKTLRSLESDEVVTQQRPIDYHPQWVVDVIEQQAVPTAMTQGSWLGETVLLDATGQEIPVSQLLLAHRSPQGTVEFFSTIMRDIRIYKDYEQRLERSNAELLRATRLKDEFLANMSHELRTPLNAILGMSEGLQEEVFGSLNDRQKKAIATIERSGQHLLGLINDILELSKIEAGKLELNITTVSIAQLCKASLDFVQQQAFKKQIQLQAVLSPTLGAMAMDERRIRQVLINLLTNAVKFTPSGGKITLEAYLEPAEMNLSEHISLFRSSTTQLFQDSPAAACYPANHYCLCLVVTDTGIGIAAADQAKLFQPFSQVDSSLNRQYEGTGLGLTLVKRIVELHGGEVSLQSELGQGSCFIVRLPYVCEMAKPTVPHPPLRSPSPETIAAPSPLQPIQSQPPLILLAEDNPANVSTFSDYLSAKGYCIVVAKNAQEAISFAQTHQPNLILMDVQMPEIDGLEAIQQIRLNPALAKIPIIALTALAMAGDRERCLQAGADDYLSKPVKLKELTIAIQRLLDTH